MGVKRSSAEESPSFHARSIVVICSAVDAPGNIDSHCNLYWLAEKRLESLEELTAFRS